MTQDFEGRSTPFADDPDEDTIELELTPEQLLGLSQAHTAAQTKPDPVESTPGSSLPASSAPQQRAPARSATRLRVWVVALAAVVVSIPAAIAWWLAVQSAAHRSPAPAVKIQAPAQVVPPPAPPPEPQGPPVRVRNPFDATEVFEFPAGTSKTEARAAVSEQLLQRAMDRRTQAAGSKQPDGRRSGGRRGDASSAATNPETPTPRP